ncbi:MAG: CRISPR-associated endonuclease Cas1 [Candidatus Thorarchaeota archaeon]
MDTIILEDFGIFLGKKSNRFIVKKKGKTIGEFPAQNVERIIISSSGASLSSAALYLAVENRVPVSFTYISGHPFAFLVPTTGHGTVLTRRSQYLEYGSARATELVKGFIIGKMKNQRVLLKSWSKTRTRTNPQLSESLYNLSSGIDIRISNTRDVVDTLDERTRSLLMHYEGMAAQDYWRGVASILPSNLSFSNRITRGAKDPFNMHLNYGYGILYSEVWSAVTKAGLDPYAGFLHVDRPGRPSLVLDLIEEFRQQIVDRPIIADFILSSPSIESLVDDDVLTKDARQKIAQLVIDRLSTKVTYNEMKSPLRNIMVRQAWNVAKYLRKEVTSYTPFHLKW